MPRGYVKKRAGPYDRGAPPSLNKRTGGFEGIELKFIDTDLPAAALGFSSNGIHDPTGDQLTPIAQGAGESNRVGRKVKIKSLELNYVIHMDSQIDAETGFTGADVRMIIVQDTQTNGVKMDGGDFFIGALLGFRNLEQGSRFIVLSDKTIAVRPTAGGFGGSTPDAVAIGCQVTGRIYLPLNVVQEYNHSDGDISRVTTNSLHLWCVYGSAEGTGGMGLQYSCRCRFVG